MFPADLPRDMMLKRSETGIGNDAGFTYFFVSGASDAGLASLSCLCPSSGTRARTGFAASRIALADVIVMIFKASVC